MMPRKSPWLFVPSMALFQALTFAYISILPGIFLKSTGASNRAVGLASLLFLPVSLRFLVGIYVDRGSKRSWSMGCQILSAAAAFAGGASILTGGPLVLTLGLFVVAALISAFQDLAMDGFFLFATTPEEKPFFSNLKVQGFRLGNIIAQGGYVMLAGHLTKKLESSGDAWGWVFILHATVLSGLFLWNFFTFPREVEPVDAAPRSKIDPLRWFAQLIGDFLKQPGMRWVIAYLLFYRIGEAMLATMKVPFLLDARAGGGLGLPLQQVGFMNGVVVFAVLVGAGLLGGIWVEQRGLAKTLIPAAVIMNLPHAVFLYLALVRPTGELSLFGFSTQPTVQVALMIEAFGYAMGFAPFLYLQITSARGPYRATLFAMLAGVTNLGWTLPGAVSGFIQEQLGYPLFFALATVVGLPIIAIIPRIPTSYLEKAE